jgi:hypothetical protein
MITTPKPSVLRELSAGSAPEDPTGNPSADPRRPLARDCDIGDDRLLRLLVETLARPRDHDRVDPVD